MTSDKGEGVQDLENFADARIVQIPDDSPDRLRECDSDRGKGSKNHLSSASGRKEGRKEEERWRRR